MTTPPLEPEEQHRTKEEALIAMTMPTPRTDAVEREHGLSWFAIHAPVDRERDLAVRMRELARQLERDLAAAQEARQAAESKQTALEVAARELTTSLQRAEALAEQNAKDAERYRWLRSNAKMEYMHPRAMEDSRMEWVFPKLFGMTCVMTEIPVDAAIDAAIRRGSNVYLF